MNNRKIFFQSVHNDPSGGTKVIHEMVVLFRERGFEAYVFSPKEEAYKPKWLVYPAPVISDEQMISLCGENDIIIGSWPSRTISDIIRKSPAKIKIFYPQCNFFVKSKNMIGDDVFSLDWGYTHFWAVSKSNKSILDKKYDINSYVIHPYFNFELYKTDDIIRKRRILTLRRKGLNFIRVVRLFFKKKIDFKVISGKFTEMDFIREALGSRFFLHTAIGHQVNLRSKLRSYRKYILSFGRVNELTRVTYAGGKYDEAFPHPPVEAALAGCVVIGFAKNGDWEWMSKDNSFIAKDRSYIDLIRKINIAIRTPEARLIEMNINALSSLQKFNKENTWREVTSFLGDTIK